MNTPAPTKTALVVDDSKSARYAMRKLLEQHGYAVDTAESPEDAYVYLQHRHPDVIFLDRQMRGRNGLETLRELKDSGTTAGIPVFICSADDDDAFRARVQAAGGVDVLSKPPQIDRVDDFLKVDVAPDEAPGQQAKDLKRGTRQRIAPLPTLTRTPPVQDPAPSLDDDTDERLTELEARITELRQELAELRSASSAEALLPLLEDELRAWIETRSTAVVRQVLAEAMERLARNLRHG